MATKPESPKPAESVPAPVALTLTEFCTRLSKSVRRPELIAAFESVEKRAGRVKDTEANFRARFDTFVNTPI